jgi:hypothetical protein
MSHLSGAEPPQYAMPLRAAQPGGGYGYGATPAPEVMIKDGKGSFVRGLLTPRNVFIITGVIILMVLCIVPLWNASSLMQDSNYVFWHGRGVPAWMVGISWGTILMYVITVFVFYGYARPQAHSEQTIMMIANIFITMFGLMLMLVSVPLSRQSITTYNNLMHKCDYSVETHRLYEYSQVLHNIRSMPSCIGRYTVEDCEGYEDAQPYTTFLKSMETDFRCSGFCYQPPSQTVALQVASGSNGASASNATVSNISTPMMLIEDRQSRHTDHVFPLPMEPASLLSTQTARAQQPAGASAQTSSASYPPTLFSDADYQASCEGMAARDMKNFAGDIGFQTFYQGIYLVMIAIATGFLKLIGFCVNRDRDEMKVPR